MYLMQSSIPVHAKLPYTSLVVDIVARIANEYPAAPNGEPIDLAYFWPIALVAALGERCAALAGDARAQ